MMSLEMSLYWFVLRPKELQGCLNNLYEPAKAEVFQSYDLVNWLQLVICIVMYKYVNIDNEYLLLHKWKINII